MKLLINNTSRVGKLIMQNVRKLIYKIYYQTFTPLNQNVNRFNLVFHMGCKEGHEMLNG